MPLLSSKTVIDSIETACHDFPARSPLQPSGIGVRPPNLCLTSRDFVILPQISRGQWYWRGTIHRHALDAFPKRKIVQVEPNSESNGAMRDLMGEPDTSQTAPVVDSLAQTSSVQGGFVYGSTHPVTLVPRHSVGSWLPKRRI